MMIRKELTLHNVNIKQKTDIQLSLILEINLQKEIFLSKTSSIFQLLKGLFSNYVRIRK